MSENKSVEDLEPGDLFIHEGSMFVCICVTRGAMDVFNLHAMKLEDFEGGRTDRDYLFTCLNPRTFKVGKNLKREHIVINVG